MNKSIYLRYFIFYLIGAIAYMVTNYITKTYLDFQFPNGTGVSLMGAVAMVCGYLVRKETPDQISIKFVLITPVLFTLIKTATIINLALLIRAFDPFTKTTLKLYLDSLVQQPVLVTNFAANLIGFIAGILLRSFIERAAKNKI